MRQHKHFGLNTVGRDFFVGDLHGHYSLLMQTLGRIGFDHDCDRLFCTGDLIDRGLQSAECVRLLQEPWFHSVVGNHECMFIVGRKDPRAKALHIKNGGSWAYEISDMEREELFETIKAEMYLGFTVDTRRGSVGVVHAQAPVSWHNLTQGIVSNGDWEKHLWSVDSYNRALTKRCKRVMKVSVVVMGHVACDYITTGANQIWIDTIIKSGHLTVIDSDRVFSEVGYE